MSKMSELDAMLNDAAEKFKKEMHNQNTLKALHEYISAGYDPDTEEEAQKVTDELVRRIDQHIKTRIEQAMGVLILGPHLDAERFPSLVKILGRINQTWDAADNL